MCPRCAKPLHWLEAAMNDCIGGLCVDCGVATGAFRESGTGLQAPDLRVPVTA